MKNIEYYNIQDDYVRNYYYYHSNFEKCFNEFYKMWAEKEKIYKFADVIIDSGLLPIERLVPKENLRKFFGYLLDISLKLGTNWSYASFLKSLFGDQIIIEIEKVCGKVIKYSIQNYNKSLYNWVMSQETTTMQTELADDIMFSEIIEFVSLEKVKTFLRYISPFQDIVDFEFINE